MSDNSMSKDEGLLAHIRKGLLESDPPPSDVADFAKAAFSWRNVDAEIAAITYDSAVEGASASVRSATAVRLLSFAVEGVSIEVEYDQSDRRLIGSVTPPATVRVELQTPDSRSSAESDTAGRFEFAEVGEGPMRLVAILEARSEPVVTEWTIL